MEKKSELKLSAFVLDRKLFILEDSPSKILFSCEITTTGNNSADVARIIVAAPSSANWEIPDLKPFDFPLKQSGVSKAELTVKIQLKPGQHQVKETFTCALELFLVSDPTSNRYQTVIFKVAK